MKPSFIIFVVVLIFIVLDLIEALPSPQGKGNGANGKGTAGKGTAGKGTAGKGTAATAQTNNGNGAKGKGAADGAKGKGAADGAKGKGAADGAKGKGTTETNAKSNTASPPPPGASAQICNNDGLTKGDGTQKNSSTCMTTQMGELPTFNNMVSSLIIAPSNGQTIKANTGFTLKVKINNMVTGNFADAAKQYYTFSQQLDKKTGNILGHSHFTVQPLEGNGTPPDARKFLFFKGLNDPEQAGVLSADVVQNNAAKTPGLPAGQYRVCSMASSFAHQPVLMPVAQRGAQDDCVRFNVQ